MMLANSMKVMICLPGLALCWALVAQILRLASLMIIPAKDIIVKMTLINPWHENFPFLLTTELIGVLH